MLRILICRLLFLICFLFTSASIWAADCDEMLVRFKGEALIAGNFSKTCFTEGRVILTEDSLCGEYTTPPVKVPFLFSELIPSFTVDSPQESSFVVHIRLSPDGDAWSPWLFAGNWNTNKKGSVSNEWGSVKIDYLVTKRAVSFFQMRFSLNSRKKGVSPAINSVTAAVSSQRTDKGLKLSRNLSVLNRMEKTELKVPFRSQGWADKSISGHICSVVSTAMVMDFWGTNVDTEEFAKIVYEPRHDMFGIWWRAVQGASVFGFDGWVQYFRSWDDVSEYIYAGIPVVACICFDDYQLKGSATQASDGHVIVISGFDANGNVICRDGAFKDAKKGIIVYSKKDLTEAWFDRGGGVGYVIIKQNSTYRP